MKIIEVIEILDNMLENENRGLTAKETQAIITALDALEDNCN